MTPRPLRWPTALLALAVGVSRGGNQVAIKFALTALTPLWSAFARMAVSVAAVGALSGATRVGLGIEAHERRPLLLLASLFAIQISMLHIGADWTSPAYAVVLINTNPIFANLIAHFFVAEDRLSVARLAGLGLAFGGVCAVFLGRPDAALAPYPLAGNLLITASASLVGARTVYIQHIVQRMEPAKAVLWQMLLALPCFALGGWIVGGSETRLALSWEPLLAIGYQGLIVGGLALVLWVRLLRDYSPGRISVFSFSTPMAGVVLSALFFGEEISERLLLGLAAVLAGIWLVARSKPGAVEEPRP